MVNIGNNLTNIDKINLKSQKSFREKDNSKALIIKQLLKSFGNSKIPNLGPNLGKSPLEYEKNIIGGFRTSMNAGDVKTLDGGATNERYGYAPNQVNGISKRINSTKLGGSVNRNGESMYSGNPSYVYDSSLFSKYRKLSTINKIISDIDEQISGGVADDYISNSSGKIYDLNNNLLLNSLTTSLDGLYTFSIKNITTSYIKIVFENGIDNGTNIMNNIKLKTTLQLNSRNEMNNINILTTIYSYIIDIYLTSLNHTPEDIPLYDIKSKIKQFFKLDYIDEIDEDFIKYRKLNLLKVINQIHIIVNTLNKVLNIDTNVIIYKISLYLFNIYINDEDINLELDNNIHLSKLLSNIISLEKDTIKNVENYNKYVNIITYLEIINSEVTNVIKNNKLWNYNKNIVESIKTSSYLYLNESNNIFADNLNNVDFYNKVRTLPLIEVNKYYLENDNDINKISKLKNIVLLKQNKKILTKFKLKNTTSSNKKKEELNYYNPIDINNEVKNEPNNNNLTLINEENKLSQIKRRRRRPTRSHNVNIINNNSIGPIKEEPIKEEPIKEDPIKEDEIKEEQIKKEQIKEENEYVERKLIMDYETEINKNIKFRNNDGNIEIMYYLNVSLENYKDIYTNSITLYISKIINNKDLELGDYFKNKFKYEINDKTIKIYCKKMFNKAIKIYTNKWITLLKKNR